ATSTQALAQGGAAAPAPIAQGPAIPGICVMSLDAAIGSSTVGKYVQTRLGQISTQVQSEVNGEQTQIANDAKAIDAKRATLDQATFDKQSADIQLRANALNRKAQLRERELQATQQKALGRIAQELDPVVRAAYQQAKCSILISRDAVIVAPNPSMDITPAVITGLNAKITQFTFDRERLDQPAPAAQTK
ncbi:MAG TPA: OmpH family outer membrane protein, partial [Phenylobacterium sp.]|nr:OmpH family outer membrane protein [Phenylobacterium sp.]